MLFKVDGNVIDSTSPTTLLSGSAPAHTKVPSPILVIPSSTTILLIKPL